MFNDPVFFNLVGGAWRAGFGADPHSGQVMPGAISILGADAGRALALAGVDNWRIAPAPTFYNGQFGTFNPYSPNQPWALDSGGLGGATFPTTAGMPFTGGWQI